MSSDQLFQNVLIWALPALNLLGQLALLIVCIFGALNPSLRREFIWLGLGSVLRCVSAVTSLIPLLMRSASGSSSMSMTDIRLISSLGGAIANISLLLYLVGFILLAVKARSLPAPPR